MLNVEPLAQCLDLGLDEFGMRVTLLQHKTGSRSCLPVAMFAINIANIRQIIRGWNAKLGIE